MTKVNVSYNALGTKLKQKKFSIKVRKQIYLN